VTPRATIDVSRLPDHAMDSRAPLWWGNLLMIFIETTTIILMLTSYYYVRRNYNVFPPPRPEPLPAMVDTTPDRTAANAQTILLMLSCGAMYLTDQMARQKRRWPTVCCLTFMVVVTFLSLWAHSYELPATHFSWADNAYASVIWTTLWLHIIYVLAGVGEFGLMWLWLLFHDIDDNHALDITLAGGYWYWVAGIWLPIYVTIFWAPVFLKVPS
jgi:cytochrome c oxidase subunit 3